MEKLKQMKDKLIEAVEKQINECLSETSTEELGDAIDMIKDLDEAIYYCTASQAMEDTHKREMWDYYSGIEKQPKQLAYPSYDGMYYSDGGRSGGQSGKGSYTGGTAYFHEPIDRYGRGMVDKYTGWEGRSEGRRKMYMEGKQMHHDKTKQMQELDAYVRELGQDLTDMIEDASPEEKQLLQQKLSALASKIK